MASVNFSEKEAGAVAEAAVNALKNGYRDRAVQLNELASKMNKSLSVAGMSGMSNMGHERKKWRAPGPIDAELGLNNSVDSGKQT